MLTYEDKVGTRVKLIDYHRMSLIMMDTHPSEAEDVLRAWGDEIYRLGHAHLDVVLQQPLNMVAS